MPAGYSGMPLARKLSLKPGARAWRQGMPASVATEIEAEGIALEATDVPPFDHAHLFTTSRAELEATLPALRDGLAPGGCIWVSWPKKAAKVPTDITEDTIRAVCLPMGLVDVKVCAVDATWSGLKLMRRRG